MRKAKKQINLNSEKYEYELFRSDRKTVGIEIRPGAQLVIRSPRRVPESEINRILNLKKNWIIRKMAEAPSVRHLQNEYVNGGRLLYLGDYIMLKLLESRHWHAELQGRILTVSGRDLSDRDTIQRKVENWYRKNAYSYFSRRLSECLPVFNSRLQQNIKMPLLKVRKMKTRWGSCHPAGRINLNLELIKASPECIDYVIYHELCHLLIPNHSRDFYALQQKVYPNWRYCREKLNRTVL